MIAMQYAGLPSLERCAAGRQSDPDGVAVLVQVALLQLIGLDLAADQRDELLQVGR